MPLERQLPFKGVFRDVSDLIMTSPPTPYFVVKLYRSSFSTWRAIFVSKGKIGGRRERRKDVLVKFTRRAYMLPPATAL
jgi:hypothetical protein